MKVKRLNVILIALFIMIGVCTTMSVSYAFYTLQGENYELSTTIDIPSCATVSITDDKSLNLSGDYAVPIKDEMLLGSDAEVMANYKYTFTLTNSCTSAGAFTVSLAPLGGSTMPVEALKYALVRTGDTPAYGTYLYSGDNAKTLTSQIISDVSAVSGHEVSTAYELAVLSMLPETTVTYDLYVWIDYYEGDQTEAGLNNGTTTDKTFNGIVVISDFYEITGVPTFSSGTNLTESIVAYGTHNTMSEDDTWGIINENGYRYEGDDPNNYVCFGSEEATCPDDNVYRIIGAFNVEYDSNSDGTADTTEYLAKVQKNTMYGGSTMAYHSTWQGVTTNSHYPNSQIYPVLNTTWHDSLSSAYQNQIASVNWNLGAGANSYTSLTAADFYSQERGTTLNTGVTESEKVFKVGMMYPSDYGYAVLSGNCARTTALYSYYNSANCYGLNWMHDAAYNQWTMTACIGSTDSGAFHANTNGSVYDNSVNNSRAVRPAFYLNPDVKITGGSGTSADPYRISL